ncbi:hypothetical protein E4K72_01950 [Oxalobacteraceae bacterium OM1]|nr:hypothetical protein E4K72_01950 [Oxalobacteraceae bacterium OM1]
MSERSEFARFPPDSALFWGPAQRAAEPGSPFFGYFFWRSKKSDRLPGRPRQRFLRSGAGTAAPKSRTLKDTGFRRAPE